MRVRRTIPLLFSVLLVPLLGWGCGGADPSGPSFEVSFESGSRRSAPDDAVRVEVYLVDSCWEVTPGARPVRFVASTYVVRDGYTGALGSAEPGDYGLYAVAQDEDCAVVAAGCAPVTIGAEDETLSVTLSRAQGEPCPIDRVCSMETGDCVDGSGGDPMMRVSDGLIVLYDFDEGSGSIVADRSGVAPTLDLTIADPTNVSWGADHLTIESATMLSTAGAATKVFNEVVPNNQITVEAWVKPASLVAVGTPPDRIVTMSMSSSRRNFLLGQDAMTYAVRFRTPGELNGDPTEYSSATAARVELQHVVYTRKADGTEVIYVDGAQDATHSRAGDTSTWDATYPLVVANEIGTDRAWLGELHLIAIYDRALGSGEVQQNFTAGP